jgi:hypothetical protein
MNLFWAGNQWVSSSAAAFSVHSDCCATGLRYFALAVSSCVRQPPGRAGTASDALAVGLSGGKPYSLIG